MTAAALGLSVEQLDHLSLDRRGYGSVPACTRVDGPLDLGALSAALRHVVERHEPLRMRLHRDGDRIRQSFPDPRDGDLRWAQEQVEDLPAALLARTTADLDPGRDGPLALHVLHEGPGRAVVLVLVHHLATDGWGSYLLAWELWRAYAALVAGRLPDLPALPVGYGAHVRGQGDPDPVKAESVRSFWAEQAQAVAGAPGLLPAPDVPGPGGGRADIAERLPEAVVRDAAELAASLSVSANTLPLAALVLAVRSLTGGDRTGLSFIYAGRDRPRTRRLVGVFHRRVPLVVDASPGTDVAGFVNEVATSALRSVRLSRPPYYSARMFDAMVREAGGRGTGVEVLCNQLDPQFGEARRGAVREVAPGTTVTFLDTHFDAGRWSAYREPRVRVMVNGGERPSVQAVFNDALLDPATARELVGRTAAGLTAMTRDGGAGRSLASVLRELAPATTSGVPSRHAEGIRT